MRKIILRSSIVVIIIIFIILVYSLITGKIQQCKARYLLKANSQLLMGIDYKKRIEKAMEERQKQVEIINETIKLIENKELAKKLQKQFNDLENKTNEIFQEKDHRITVLENQLTKTSKMLNEINRPFGFGIYAMGGFTDILSYNTFEDISFDLVIGMDVALSFFNNRIIFLVGPYIKPFEDLGIGVKAEMIFMFGKRKIL